MRKYLLFCTSFILLSCFGLFIFMSVVINIKANKNEKLINIFNNVLGMDKLNITLDYKISLPRLEIGGIDYIGIINIDNMRIPVESRCNHFFSPACSYSDNPFIILGNNLKFSFLSYKLCEIGDIIMFTNTLGMTFQYKIKDIKRLNELGDISQYVGDLVIVIKNYYGMEYVLFTFILE